VRICRGALRGIAANGLVAAVSLLGLVVAGLGHVLEALLVGLLVGVKDRVLGDVEAVVAAVVVANSRVVRLSGLCTIGSCTIGSCTIGSC